MRPIATAALEVDGITRSFGGLVALKKVSFRVHQGEILGLIGPNGAGKSTLFEVVSGGIPPDEGRVKYFGEDITGQPIHERRRRGLCRTYQKVRLFEQLTIEQNVAVAANECSEDRRSWRDHVATVLSDLQISGLGSRYPSEVTLADRKRVEIARAIVGKCRILMLDESLCGLTNEEMAELISRIRVLNEAHGVTIIVVEHVMPIIMALAQRLVVLDYGSVIAEGNPADIANDPAVIAAYLGTKHGIKRRSAR